MRAWFLRIFHDATSGRKGFCVLCSHLFHEKKQGSELSPEPCSETGGEGGIRTPEALIRTCTLSRGVHSTSLPLLRIIVLDAQMHVICGAPGRIRTHDPLVRSQILYPTELLPRQNCRSRILANPKKKGKAFCENTANAVSVPFLFSRFACGTVFSGGHEKRPPKRMLQGP